MFNYDFYIASIVVLAVLIAYYSTMKITRDLAARTYGVLLGVSFSACVTDVISGGVFMTYFPENVPLNYLAQIISCSSLHLLPVVFFYYMTILSRKLQRLPRKYYLWGIFALIEQVLIYTTPLTGWVFTYSAQEKYARGPLMWILVAVAVFYILNVCLEIVVHEKEQGGRYRLITLVFVSSTLVCMVIQMWDSYYVLLGASTAVNCLIMQLALYNPRLVEEANQKEIEARKEAEEANRAKSSFLANMSHEIRTPMNAICGMAEILGKNDLRPIERDYVRTIQEAGQSLLHIIDDVLDFSKIDADEMELVEEDYYFDQLMMGVEDIIAARLQEKKIRFEINMGDSLPRVVRGDKMKIHQILINILGNAVKFTEKGKITLDIEFAPRQDGRLLISFMVTDTGIGIKQEDMGKLFNRFSQVDGRYNRKVEGTGLGLVLSRKLARLMGGDVTASSEFGVGSCFKIVIIQKEGTYFKDDIDREKLKDFQAYVYEEDSEERWYLSRILSQMGVSTIFLHDERQLADLAAECRREEGGKENRILFYSYEGNHQVVNDLGIGCRKVALMEYYTRGADWEKLDYYLRKPLDVFKVVRVLTEESPKVEGNACPKIALRDARIAIVDDNRVNVKVAVTLLKEFGARMEAFTSGEGILKALERGRTYDMIFMDHMMPEMSGVEAARRIREMPGEYPAKAVIIALTANAIEGVEEDYREVGMNDWIFKPVNLERMQEKIIKYMPPEKVMYCEGNEG